jgi:DNA-binding CsgD family transcriptional regulator
MTGDTCIAVLDQHFVVLAATNRLGSLSAAGLIGCPFPGAFAPDSAQKLRTGLEKVVRHGVPSTLDLELDGVVVFDDAVRVRVSIYRPVGIEQQLVVVAAQQPPSSSALPATVDCLSERETQICRLLASGYSGVEISELTGLSLRAVEQSRQYAAMRLGIPTRCLTAWAGRHAEQLGALPFESSQQVNEGAAA